MRSRWNGHAAGTLLAVACGTSYAVYSYAGFRPMLSVVLLGLAFLVFLFRSGLSFDEPSTRQGVKRLGVVLVVLSSVSANVSLYSLIIASAHVEDATLLVESLQDKERRLRSDLERERNRGDSKDHVVWAIVCDISENDKRLEKAVHEREALNAEIVLGIILGLSAIWLMISGIRRIFRANRMMKVGTSET